MDILYLGRAVNSPTENQKNCFGVFLPKLMVFGRIFWKGNLAWSWEKGERTKRAWFSGCRLCHTDRQTAFDSL